MTLTLSWPSAIVLCASLALLGLLAYLDGPSRAVILGLVTTIAGHVLPQLVARAEASRTTEPPRGPVA